MNKGVSARKSCDIVRISRSLLYKKKPRKNDDIALAEIRSLAEKPKHERLGYRMLLSIYKNSGKLMNHKRFFRLYKIAGLSLKQRKKKKILRERTPLLLPSKPGMSWSMDFVFDKTQDGRPIKILTIVDDCSKESLWMEASRGIGSHKLTEVLETICLIHGVPKQIRSDNGPEFIAGHTQIWMKNKNIEQVFIQPGKPTQNAYIESFNGKFRNECLSIHLFESLESAQNEIEEWRIFYNEERPHSSLNGIPPRQFLTKFQLT
jgi:putative transposase